jgi:hypothetical protein
MKPYDFKWTRFYEEPPELLNRYPGLIQLAEGELAICSTIIDKNNWSILTTQRLLTQMDDKLTIGSMDNCKDFLYGDFKGYVGEETTKGSIQLANGMKMTYLIETGKASMVMIHGVRAKIMIG